jgi:hypothetical protein
VAVEDSPIETRSVYRTAISVFNRDRRIVVERAPDRVRYGQAVEITGRAPGAETVELRRGHQLLAVGDLQDGRWRVSVPASVLGMGEVRVQLRAVFAGGRGVRSDALAIRVGEPARLPAAVMRPPEVPGLLAHVRDAQGGVRELQIEKLDGRLKVLEKREPAPVRIQLQGYLKVEHAGTYQLALRSHGRLRLRLHDKPLLDTQILPGEAGAFVALGLEAGWHPLTIELEPAGRQPSLRVALAGRTVPALLAAPNLAHDAAAASK